MTRDDEYFKVVEEHDDRRSKPAGSETVVKFPENDFGSEESSPMASFKKNIRDIITIDGDNIHSLDNIPLFDFDHARAIKRELYGT